MSRWILCSGLALSVAFGSASDAVAQQAGPPPPPAEAAAPSRGQLEEVVVTAEHRSEDINKVPMSITA